MTPTYSKLPNGKWQWTVGMAGFDTQAAASQDYDAWYLGNYTDGVDAGYEKARQDAQLSHREYDMRRMRDNERDE